MNDKPDSSEFGAAQPRGAELARETLGLTRETLEATPTTELAVIKANALRIVAMVEEIVRDRLPGEVEALAKAAGISARDLHDKFAATLRGNRKTSGKTYVNPDNEHDVWRGRGRKPKWLRDKLLQGFILEEFDKDGML